MGRPLRPGTPWVGALSPAAGGLRVGGRLRARPTRQPVLVTRFGEPVAQVVPPPPPHRAKSWLGGMAGTGRIVGDIVAPASDESDWGALRS